MSTGLRSLTGDAPQRAAARRGVAPQRRWRLRPYQWLNLAIIAIYLVVGLAGITNSNLGIYVNRQDMYAAHPDTIGTPQGVRSDEYLVETPLALWTLAAPGEALVGEMSALSGWTMRIPTGPAQTVLFWDRALLGLGHVISEATAFALQWWLPHLLVLLFTPALFHFFGARRRYGYAAALLIILSPAQTWWSMQPSVILGPTITGCVAMLAAYRRLKRGEWVIPILQLLTAAALLASVTPRYIVWVLLLGGAVLGATLARILVGHGFWRAKLITVLGAGVVALGLTVAAVLESREGLQAFLGTVYPGARRSSATAQDLPAIFGAPFLSALATNEPLKTNASELSSSFNIVLVVIALILATQVPQLRAWWHRPHEVFLGVWALIWFGWGSTSLGDLGERIPLFSSVPPYRVIQVIGFVGILLFFLMLSHLAPIHRPWVVTVSGIAAWLSLYAGSLMQERNLHGLPTWVIWAGGLGVGVSTFCLLSWPKRIWPMALTAVLASAITISSMPIQIGLGDLRGSALSERLLSLGQEARAKGEVWASDSLTFDSLMVATGVPSLSGFQRSGPNKDQWRRLDPTEASINAWNRSAGYARFNWIDGATLKIADNGFDVVWVTTDPCELAEAMPELTHIVSTRRLRATCLTPSARYTWGRAQLTEYTVTR